MRLENTQGICGISVRKPAVCGNKDAAKKKKAEKRTNKWETISLDRLPMQQRINAK